MSTDLFEIVKGAFTEPATPGTIRAYLNREHGKTVDYEAARSLQRRLKTYLSKGRQSTSDSSRARHTKVHGR